MGFIGRLKQFLQPGFYMIDGDGYAGDGFDGAIEDDDSPSSASPVQSRFNVRDERHLPTVEACVSVIANSLARSKPQVVDADGRVLIGHPAQRWLSSPGNIEAFRLWMWLYRGMCFNGTGALYVPRGRGMLPSAHPVSWITYRSGAIGDQRYDVGLFSGKTYRLDASYTDVTSGAYYGVDVMKDVPGSDLILMSWRDWNPLTRLSLSPIRVAARRAVNLQLQTRSRTELAVRTPVPRGVWQQEGIGSTRQTPEERVKAIIAMEEIMSEQVRSGQRDVGAEGFKFQTTPAPDADDLALINVMEWTTADICRAYGVVPRGVFQFNKSSKLATGSGQLRDIETHSIAPHRLGAESALTYSLLSRLEQSRGVSIILKGTPWSGLAWEDLADALQKLVDSGMMTANEARFELGLPLSTDPQANVLYRAGSGSRDAPSQTETDGI